jgi:hypothetical protein
MSSIPPDMFIFVAGYWILSGLTMGQHYQKGTVWQEKNLIPALPPA